MALTTQSGNLVRQKAYNAVYGVAQSGGANPKLFSPENFYGIKALFLHLAANKGNPDLQFIAYNRTQVTTGTGFAPGLATSFRLFAIFGVTQQVARVANSFLTVYDANSNAAATAAVDMTRLSAIGQNFLKHFPDGHLFTTDLDIFASTTANGAVASAVGDAPDGFVIVGNP